MIFSVIELRIKPEEKSSFEEKFVIPDEDERSEAIVASILWGIDKSGKLDTEYLEIITRLSKVKYEDKEEAEIYDGQDILILLKEKEVRCFDIGFVTTYLTEMFPKWKFKIWFDTSLYSELLNPQSYPQSPNVRVFEYD